MSPLTGRWAKFLSPVSKLGSLERRLRRGGIVPPNTGREFIMQYVLLIYANEAGFQTLSKAQGEQMMAAYGAYSEALQKAGVLLGGNRLRPTGSATTVRVAEGKTNVLNGPYVETKEQLGGYYIIDAPDLDAALSWAARCPGASHGAIEVRPIWEM